MPVRDLVKRRQFASEFAASGNATRSAMKAGVPSGSAHSMGYRWLRTPEVAAMIREELDANLKTLGPAAVAVLHELLENPETPPQVRLSAARDVLDRLGWVPPKRAEMVDDRSLKPVYKLTRAELEAIVAQGSADTEDAQEPDE